MSDSKYTNPTGPGYLGIWSTHRWSVTIYVGTLEQVDWEPGDHVYVIDDDIGLGIVDEEPPDYLDQITATRKGPGVAIGVPSSAMRKLDGFDAGDDVRAYERSAGGIRLVPAADDPMLVTDGGHPAPTTPDVSPEWSLSEPILLALFVVAVVFHVWVDVLVTVVAWHLESNPVVTRLGLTNWLLIKAGCLIALIGIFAVQPRTKYQPLLIASWLGILIGMGISLILPNVFILLQGVLG